MRDAPEKRRTASATVALGMGSNLGDRSGRLAAARIDLEAILYGPRWSALYETEPVDDLAQPAFLNACAVGETRLTAQDLLNRLEEIERRHGRERTRRRFGPRTLDLDILLYGADIVRTERLVVPHPRLCERAFALIPLAELTPDWLHPELDRTIGELAEEVGSNGVDLYRTVW